MKHDELQEDLASHLLAGTDRMVWTNTQLGPAGSPRPDVFCISKSFSRPRADAYEIKVSVSDLRSDVTSGKWQSYRKFANTVYFAFPRGMAPLELIPKECGVILRSDAGWRAARKPVAQVHDNFPRDMWLKLLMECHSGVFGQLRQRPTGGAYLGEQLIRKNLGRELADLYRDVHNAEASLRYRLERAQSDRENHEKQVAQERTWREQQERATAARLDEGLDLLADKLGLPLEGRTPSALCSAITSFRTSLEARDIDRAIKTLVDLRGALVPSEVTA